MGFKNLSFLGQVHYNKANHAKAWGLMLRILILRTLLFGFCAPSKWNKFSDDSNLARYIYIYIYIYILLSLHLDTVVLFHSVLWMCEGRSCKLIFTYSKPVHLKQMLVYVSIRGACYQICSTVPHFVDVSWMHIDII